MPVLIKTRGKTTTDHISPAGPWLRFCGHLDKFSDNMFLGATNAYTGEAGSSKNVLTGKTGQSVAGNARYYQSQGINWLVRHANGEAEMLLLRDGFIPLSSATPGRPSRPACRGR